MSSALCPSARLIASTLKESSEATFLLTSEGVVLYENPAAKRLIFEKTDSKFDSGAGDPKHSYHFSFFFSFTKPSKAWQEYFDDLVNNSPCSSRRTFDLGDDAMHEYYDVTCKKSNNTEFPASLRLSKVGNCPCCEAAEVFLSAHVKAKLDDQNNPFAQEDTNSLRSILDNSFDPVFSIDDTGTILMANAAAEHVFGYSKNELMGSNIKMICGGDHGPKHDEYIKNYLESGVKKVIGLRREVPARRKDGHEFAVELGVKEINSDEYGIQGRAPSSGTDTRRFFCAFLKDISHEKKHEADMQHRVDLMQGMIDSSFDPMFQIDEKGIIQNVNTAAAALFGYKREEMLSHNISLICGQEHAASHDAYLLKYLQTGRKSVIGRKRQVTAKRKGGKEFPIELGVQEVISSTGEKLFCGFIRDLTVQMLAKRRMRKNEDSMKGQFFGSTDNDKKYEHSTTM